MTGESNEVDVAVTILRAAAEGIKKTEIIYRCNLDHVILNNYLCALMELELLKAEKTSETFYQTTEKGLQLLHIYHKLKWLLSGRTFDFLLVRLIGRLLLNKHVTYERPLPGEDSRK
ncbi:MAG: hypothetical protein JSV85_00710 [Candidatus Bathyarchaeota archaeon]|nr:MAG: hypothetical protein JSV85_00710 [Candidatus Bathyarchaeota archaeon]